MASLLTADLPSEDEEDQDFVPQAEAAPKLAGKRVAALGQPFAAPQQSAAKRAKIEAAWELLNKPVGRPESRKGEPQQEQQPLEQQSHTRQTHPATSSQRVASQQRASERVAQPNIAISQPDQSGGPQPQTSRALLAARAAAAGLSGPTSTATVTRQFAGKNIQICAEALAKPAKVNTAAKAAKQKSSLDAVLSSLQATKRANVLDKSRGDWTAFKRSDKSADEELLAHTNSNKKYLDKVDFLKRAEINEYEQETAARLQGDIRLRGQS
ncbi:hypothetical protein WJX74_009919 [Apatococcus lobatus]|uniref:BCNT-C domain-containing protein n=1 Tax=Apatococcus lobatus TaxID=904363 RepID=A0AAW1RTN2_9CHLO